MAKIILLALVVVLFSAPLLSKTILRLLCDKRYCNGFRPFAPNWLTVYSLVLTTFGFYLYLIGKPVWGIAISFYGAMLDHFDGEMARAQEKKLETSPTFKKDTDCVDYVYAKIKYSSGKTKEERLGWATTWIGRLWLELNFNGGTKLGEVFDPFADKVKALSILAYFGFWADILNPWFVGIIIAPEIFGTLIRPPFWEKFSTRDSASWVGKTKATLQWLSIICCVVVDLSHAEKTDWSLVPNSILGLTILFAVGSVYSRLDYRKLFGHIKAYLKGRSKKAL